MGPRIWVEGFQPLQSCAGRPGHADGRQRRVSSGGREDLPIRLVEFFDSSTVERGAARRIRQSGTLACVSAWLPPVASDRNDGHALLYEPENLGCDLQNERRHGWRRESPWP